MPSPMDPGRLAAARRCISALATQRGAAGLQYLVVRDREPLVELCHGVADCARNREVSSDTTFNAYSIAKTLTAAAVIALAQSGRVDLDAPVGTAADIDGLAAFGSIRETLLHRAGFPNPNPLPWIHLAESHDRFDEPSFVRAQLSRLAGTRRSRAASRYSNLGYMLLGLVIERAAGAPFASSIREWVLEPLGLRADQSLGFAIEDPRRHARGHLRRYRLPDLALGLFLDRSSIVEGVHGRWVRLRLHHVNGSAYGGLMANARGLARFGEAILGSDGGMSAAARRSMTEVIDGPGRARSLGMFAGTLKDHRWLAHAGGGLGAYGELRIYPQLRTVSVLLTNGPGFSDARCLDRIDLSWLDP